MATVTTTNERGSALVITLMLLLILTAIGIYAVSISTTEMDIALHSKVGAAVLNSAESGANYGIDQVPNVFTTAYAATLPDQSSYSMTSRATGTLTLRPGYGSNLRFADFEVTSQGQAPPAFVARRSVQVVVMFGPVPVGTMY
ncbi:MAG: PilX N-terminal domain-containing pilus assembly protein [Deltaproteobacteria bacterium]|nr:PilX N-terminal domain-containing pilus assembly protein [Deltaproteobacteria bacterium]